MEDHLEVIWQPMAAQDLLWNLIITALMLIIPCRLPYSFTEHPIGEATVARMLDNPGFSKEILVIVFNLLGTKHLFTTSDNSSCICAKCVLLLLQQKEVFGVELLRLFLSICLSVIT